MSMWPARSEQERQAFFSGLDADTYDLMVEEDEAKVVLARENIVDFFEYVMRSHPEGGEIVAQPHQRVFLDFVMHHDRSVNMLPVGHSKTYMAAAITLFLLGRDQTLRGAIVSATQEQAQKVLAVVADYILSSGALRRVFPDLMKSERLRDPWTQTKITVRRPPGIPDASLFAVGIDGGITGSRLNWIVVDDILNRENTSTKGSRDKVYEFLDSTVLNRLDPVGAKVIVTNTTWHPDDLVHRLEKMGWPTLRMDVVGDVRVQDDAQWMREGRDSWDHPGLRPATTSKTEECYRLRGNDPDKRNEKSLWPSRFPMDYVDSVLRTRHLPIEFNRAYMLTCRDEATSMCKREYIDLALRLAREKGVFSMVRKYEGSNVTFTGVDLAVSPGEEHDDTAFFTFEAWPDGTRRILDIEIGQWSGPDIMEKLFQKQVDYNSVIRVESNASQDFIRQFALQKDRSLPVKAHHTGRAKAHPEHGVAGMFLEMSNGSWLIPNDERGTCHPMVEKFINACLYYAPSRHTDDVLMAAYMAREQAKEWGMMLPDRKDKGGSVAMSVTSR